MRNFPEVKEVSKSERIELAKEFVYIGKKYGITIKVCAEGNELEPYGVDCKGCMTTEVFEKAIDSPPYCSAEERCQIGMWMYYGM